MATFDTMNELYNCLKLYIVASRYEGGPQAILECAITKTPIISTDVGVASEILASESIFNMENYINAKPNIEYAFKEASKFEMGNIIIEEDTLEHIIDKYTEKEDGVRNLKRCLEIIYTKLNLYRLMPADSSLFKEEKSFKVEFPFTVTSKTIDKLIKQEQPNDNWKRMYM